MALSFPQNFFFGGSEEVMSYLLSITVSAVVFWDLFYSYEACFKGENSILPIRSPNHPSNRRMVQINENNFTYPILFSILLRYGPLTSSPFAWLCLTMRFTITLFILKKCILFALYTLSNTTFSQTRLHLPQSKIDVAMLIERERSRSASDVLMLLRVAYDHLLFSDVRAAWRVHDEGRRHNGNGNHHWGGWRGTCSAEHAAEVERLFAFLGGTAGGRVTAESVARVLPPNGVLSHTDLEEVVCASAGGLTIDDVAALFTDNSTDKDPVRPSLFFQSFVPHAASQGSAVTLSKHLDRLLECETYASFGVKH